MKDFPLGHYRRPAQKIAEILYVGDMTELFLEYTCFVAMIKKLWIFCANEKFIYKFAVS